MCKFDFIVVGPAKTGTTSLHYYLKSDKRISLPPSKEVPLFDKKCIGSIADFFNNNRIDSSKICGKITPQYFSNKEAISNILKHNNKVKIIVILRNPIERLISHYQMLKSRELTTESIDCLFKKYLNNDIEFDLKKIFLDSEYDYFIDNIYDKFPSQNVLILDFHRVVKNDSNEMKKLYEFLSLTPQYILKFPKKNTNGFDYIKKMGDPLYWQRKKFLKNLYPLIRFFFPKKYRKKISFFFKTFSHSSFHKNESQKLVSEELKIYFNSNSKKYFKH
jgi:hypothetical protein